MAQGSPKPLWPLVHDREPEPEVRTARQFGTKRSDSSEKCGGDPKYHAGIDLGAERGTLVVAPEAATVVATQTFNGPNAHALLLETDSGIVLMLGEVEPDSWEEFGLKRGSRVGQGWPVARVGINPNGGTMLHFETYKAGTRQNSRWCEGRLPPSLLDPSDYIRRAAKWWTHYPLFPVPIPPTPDPTPPMPDPTPRPVPADGGGAGGLLIVAALAAMYWGAK